MVSGPSLAFILQPPFKFQPAAHRSGPLILAPKGYQTLFIIVKLKLKQAAQWSCDCSLNHAQEAGTISQCMELEGWWNIS